VNLTSGKAFQVRSDVSKNYMLRDRRILVRLSQLFYVRLAKLPQILCFGVCIPRAVFLTENFPIFHVFHSRLVKADMNYMCVFIYVFI